MFPYNPILEEQSKYLKANLSKADRILENLLRKKFPEQIFEIKVPIDDYIVDFWFPEKNIVIEIDPEQQENTDAYVYHAERKEKLESLSLKVFRIGEKEILNNSEKLSSVLSEMFS